MCCRGAARDGGCRAANAPLDDVLAVVAERQCQAVVATGSTRAGAPPADGLLIDTEGPVASEIAHATFDERRTGTYRRFALRRPKNVER